MGCILDYFAGQIWTAALHGLCWHKVGWNGQHYTQKNGLLWINIVLEKWAALGLFCSKNNSLIFMYKTCILFCNFVTISQINCNMNKHVFFNIFSISLVVINKFESSYDHESWYVLIKIQGLPFELGKSWTILE